MNFDKIWTPEDCNQEIFCIFQVLELEGIIGNLRLELEQSEDKQKLMSCQLKEAQEKLDTCNYSLLDQTTDEATAAMQVNKNITV